MKTLLLLACSFLVGVSLVVWGDEVTSFIDGSKLHLLEKSLDDLPEMSDPDAFSDKDFSTCLEQLEYLAGFLPEALPSIEQLKASWDQSSDSLPPTQAVVLCQKIRDSMYTRSQSQQKSAAFRQSQDLMDEANKIKFAYTSVGMTSLKTDTLSMIHEMQQVNGNTSGYISHDSQYWSETTSNLVDLMTPVFEQYQQDFSDILAQEDSPFWGELEKHYELGSAPPLSQEPTLDQLIVIDLSDQMLYAYEGKYLIMSTAITTGQVDYPTRPGQYSVLEKKNGKWMNSPFPNEYYRLWVDYWIRFSWGGYGMHDSCNAKNCWRTVYGTQDYGYRGSHGCVNMPYDAVAKIYKWVTIGTKVVVQN